MTEEASVPEEAPRGYFVDPNYKPRPQDRLGSYRTDNLGVVGMDITSLSSGFRTARRRSLMTAAQALTGSNVVAESQVNVADASQRGDVLARVLNRLEDVKQDITFADEVASRTIREPVAPIVLPETFMRSLGTSPA